MKIGIDKETKVKFLVFETLDDIDQYQSVYEKESQDMMWKTYLSSSRMDMSDMFTYMSHRKPGTIPSQRMLAYHLETSRQIGGIFTVAEFISNSTTGKINNMRKYLREGEMLRVNMVGGFLPISNLNEFEEVYDIDIDSMLSYIITGEDDAAPIVLDSENIFIENDYYKDCEDYVIEMQNKFNFGTNFKVIDRFEFRTIKFEQSYFFDLLTEGFKNGLKRIFIKTTGANNAQMELLEKIKPALDNFKIELHIKKV